MTPSWEIAIAYDSEARPGFRTGWGFSAVVTSQGRRALFDCGWDGHMLRWNLGRMGLTMADIDKVVLSHSHWDHTCGLTEVLAEPLRSEALEVFVPSSFSENLKSEIASRAALREVSGPVEVLPGVMSTGELGAEVKEQSLVIVGDSGGVVLTGCAHPGVSAILARAEEIARPAWLIGGLHGAEVSDIPAGLSRLVLCHCTRAKAAMVSSFPEIASTGKVGDRYGP